MIIIPIKWRFVWEYTLFSDKPKWVAGKFSEVNGGFKLGSLKILMEASGKIQG
jgi:hypothetical protein